MRITTRLKIISVLTLATLAMLIPFLIGAYNNFEIAKSDVVIVLKIKDAFFENEFIRNQYLLYREDLLRVQWEKTKEATDSLLNVAVAQFRGEPVLRLLQNMLINAGERREIFQRIVSNIHAQQTSLGKSRFFEELHQRLASQLLLRASAFRVMADELHHTSEQHVEQTYRKLAVYVGVFAIWLALVILLTAHQISRLIQQGLLPLHHGALAVTHGDLGYKIKRIDAADEFSELANYFNDMTDKLQASYEELKLELDAHKQSEEKLSVLNRNFVTFLENTTDFIYFKDENSRFCFCSQTLADITGHASWHDMIGKQDSEVFPQDTAQIYIQEEVPIFRDGKPLLRQVDPYYDVSKNPGWVSTSKWPLLDSQGKVVGLFGISRDITEQIKSEDALKQALDRLQKITSRVPGIVTIQLQRRSDGSFCVPYVSVTLKDIYRVSPDEIRDDATPLFAPVHPDDLPQFLASLAISANTMTPWLHGYRLKFSGAPEISLVINAVPQREENGALLWCGFITDISERKQVEGSLRETRAFLEAAMDCSEAGIAIAEAPSGLLRYVNDAALLIRGGSRQDIVNGVGIDQYVSSWQILDLDGQPLRNEDVPLTHAILFGKKCSREFIICRAEGDDRVVWANAAPITNANGQVTAGIVVFLDITDRKQAEEKQKLAASVFTHADEGILITDADANIIDSNEAFTYITSYTKEEVLGQNPRILSSGRHEKAFYIALWRDLIDKGHWYGEIWNRRKNAEVYAVMQNISAVRDAQGKTQHYVALFSDITMLKAHESQLEHLAHYDTLTLLPNRALLADRLRQYMAQTHRRGQMMALAYLDLDGFKCINDTHGHQAGDHLLITVSDRMKQTLREGDTLARIGGDEFVAVLNDLNDVSVSVQMLDRLLMAAAEPLLVGDLVLKVSASIGVTFYPQAEDIEPDQLLRQADQAMYQAKLSGRNCFHVFDPEIDRDTRGRHEGQERIRQAMSAGEFVLYYQPKVNARKGIVVGAEALIRWQHPQRGLLPPVEFLPVIENHPLAINIGEWVIDSTLGQMTMWQDAGVHIPVSVNVSARQLQQTDFVNRLRALLAKHPQVSPHDLKLEILETSALQDLSRVSNFIELCREFGVTFSLDDFGTGYSSLTYLKRLAVAELKIDQSFVFGMLNDPDDLAILEGVLNLANSFHRQVVAEGVETMEHGEMLLRLGCELFQGYGIARPMPADDFPKWAAAWHPDPLWVNLPSVSRVDLPLLFASAEHRAWLVVIVDYLQGKRMALPLNHQHCRFNIWLENEGVAYHGAQSGFQAIELMHRQLHALAAELMQIHADDRNAQALARLPELFKLSDALLKQLWALIPVAMKIDSYRGRS